MAFNSESGIVLDSSTPAQTVVYVGYIKGLRTQLEFLQERRQQASRPSIKGELEREIRRVQSEFNHTVAQLLSTQGLSLTLNEFTIVNVQNQPTDQPTE